MDNLLEMVKNDRNAREFLHECYMEDPDHIGTGFSRWLEENEDVLPVYLECMMQIDGSTGSLLESFVLARMETGNKFMPEATLRLNKNDLEKFDTDKGYQAVFEIVKEFISNIVNQAVNEDEVVLGRSKQGIGNFQDIYSAIRSLDMEKNPGIATNIVHNIERKIDQNDSANNLITSIFKNNKDSFRRAYAFALRLFMYIREYADKGSQYHKSIYKIVKDGGLESDIYEFAKYAFLYSIGADTGEDNSVAELKSILKNILPSYDNYMLLKEKAKEAADQIIENYNSGITTVPEIAKEFGMQDDIFKWMKKFNPTADKPKLEKRLISTLRNDYINKIKHAIENSNLDADEKSNLNNATKQNGALYGDKNFTKSIIDLNNDAEKFATTLLSNTKYKVTRDIEADKTNWNKHTQRDQLAKKKASDTVVKDMVSGFNNINERLSCLKDGGFIEDLLEEYKKHEDIDMDEILQSIEIDAPCWDDNFGNAIMTRIFGIGETGNEKYTTKHNKLKQCVEDAMNDYEKNPEIDIIDAVYRKILETINKNIIGGVNAAKNLVIANKDKTYMYTDFDVSWTESPTEHKEAYMHMLKLLGIGR